MFESVVAYITKAGYDLIAKKLAGDIDRFEITHVAFGGGLSPASLTPYKPSITDTAIPNELFRIPKDQFESFYDPLDGLPTLKVTVPRDLAGSNYLNAVGVIANDEILFASNSLALLKVDTGSEVILNIKIPLFKDENIDLVNLTPPTPENVTFAFETYQVLKTSQIIPAGHSGVFYELTLNKPSVYCYLDLVVSSLTPLDIDYLTIGLESVEYGGTVLFSNITLDTSTNPRLSIKIPQPFKQLVIANKLNSNDVIYDLTITGVKVK